MLLKLAEEIQAAIKQKKVVVNWNRRADLANKLANVMLDFPEKPKGYSLKILPTTTYKKVVLVSGGMDSTVMWWLQRDEPDKLALYVDLGLDYCKKEIAALKRSKIPALVVKYKLDKKLMWKHIVPTRNFLLIALAEQYVADGGEIWLGAVEGESSEKSGDKSDKFFELCEQFIKESGKQVTIKTLKNKTKNDWLALYLKQTQDTGILNTVTCYAGTKKGCGKCQACVRKWIALIHCGEQTLPYFEANPYVAGRKHIEKYQQVLNNALKTNDFSHYSKRRCEQDLAAIYQGSHLRL